MAKSTSIAMINLFAAAFWMIILMASPVHAFIRHLCFNPLGFARVDPIMAPNVPSQHLHHLHGSSHLGLYSLDAQDFLDGNCTSCSITADRSGYWTPAMYFQHDNGTFELLTTSSAITVYYKLEKRVNFENQNYTVFPQGFRMIAGSSPKRIWDGPWPVPPQSFWGPNDTTQAALAEKSIGFNCLNYPNGPAEPSFGYPWLRNKTFIDNQCVDGVRAEVMFPSCWDGVNLDSPNHKDHVAFPTLIQDGACPDSHPVYLPVLFYETIWDTPQFAGMPGQFVMSNGDPTGYGYHGDFFAAWQGDALERIAEDPTCTDHNLTDRVTTGLQQDCAAINQTIQLQSVAATCKLEVPEVLEKDVVFGLINMLPGNVSITGVRHDPGSPPPDVSPASISISAAMSNSVGPSGTVVASSQSTSTAANAAMASSCNVPSDFSTLTSSSISSSSTDEMTSTTSEVSTGPTTSATAIVTPEASASPTSAAPTTVTPEALATLTSAAGTTAAAVNVFTSTYVSDGVYVELVVVETTVTTTVEATAQPSIMARYKHGHGHKRGIRQ